MLRTAGRTWVGFEYLAGPEVWRRGRCLAQLCDGTGIAGTVSCNIREVCKTPPCCRVKNPLANIITAWRTWTKMRRFQGVFSLQDSLMQINRVILPMRFHLWLASSALNREAKLVQEPDGVWRIKLVKHGLVFFWPERPTANLWFLIEQEFNPRNPHCYTTPPIALGQDSLVLDVGACEGLFAFRVLKNQMAKRVICFEPFGENAKLIRRGAAANDIAELVHVETLAVSRKSGRVSLARSDAADHGAVREGEPTNDWVPAISLDEYCATRGIEMKSGDFIKVDAEGADMNVLLGAERIISEIGPQIAVTTYHDDSHSEQIIGWLRAKQPKYRMRLKGFSFWTSEPRPVLLLAAQ